MPNTRCHHNNWAIDCDACELEALRVMYAAVCDELEQAQNELDSADQDTQGPDNQC